MSMTREEKRETKTDTEGEEHSSLLYSSQLPDEKRGRNIQRRRKVCKKIIHRVHFLCNLNKKHFLSQGVLSSILSSLFLDDSERQETVLCQFKTSYTIKKKKQQKKTQLAFIGHRDFFLFFSETESQVMF